MPLQVLLHLVSARVHELGVVPMVNELSTRFSGTSSLSLRNNLSPSSVKPSVHSSSDGALTAFQYLLQCSDAA